MAIRTETKGDRTRTAIVTAAAEEFAEHGFDGARGARIAAVAGVSEPSIAFHFGSKSGLLIAVMDDYYDGLVERLEVLLDGAGDPRGRLDALARFWIEELTSNNALIEAFRSAGRRPGGDGSLTAAFRDNNRKVTRRFERVIEDLQAAGALRDDVSARIVRDGFFGTAEHVIIGRLLSRRRSSVEDSASQVVDLLLNGAAAPAARTAAPAATLASIQRSLDELLARIDT